MKAILVVGATATGKSHLALELAKKHNGVIINSDSIQFYQPLRIGSAAPSDEDLKQAPHYLYSYVNPPTEMTAGDFLREFHKLLEKENFNGRPLIIVGGTGFYIQALEKGMFNVPPIDPDLKIRIEQEIAQNGTDKAYQELIQFDPETKVHKNDGYRIGRALELKRAFQMKMSDLHKQAELDTKLKIPCPYIKFGVDLDKEVLFKNIHQRTASMLSQGIIEETEYLLKQGHADWAPLNSVGYYEVKQFLQGDIDQTELEAAINLSTQQLTKKQKTWFKRDPDIQWIKDLSTASISEAQQRAESFLNS